MEVESIAPVQCSGDRYPQLFIQIGEFYFYEDVEK